MDVRGVTWQWRLLRALACAVAAAGIGVGGHAFAMSGLPRWEVFLAWVPVATLFAYPLTHGRLRAWLLFAATALLQLCVHLSCTLVTQTGGGGMPAMDHSGMSMADHAAHMQPMHGMEAHAVSTPVMVLVHLLATFVAVALLLQVEKRAWRAIKVVATRITRRIAPVLPARPLRATPSVVSLAARHLPWPQRWLVHVVGRRGPPTPSCV